MLVDYFSSHSWWWIDLFCADNLIHNFWIEGTTTSSTDVNHPFLWPDEPNTL